MRVLYFDIDGTILRDSEPKPNLAYGGFEAAVRKAGFQRLVCVSNLIVTIQYLHRIGQETDGLGIVLEVCRGTIQDEAWFRNATTLVSDPEHRGGCIDLATDWWYLDDMARWFLERDGLDKIYRENIGARIYAPHESGSGAGVVDWLRSTARWC